MDHGRCVMLEFFHSSLASLDPAVAGLIEYEAERQARKLILIPSESQAPAAVREALGSVFPEHLRRGLPGPQHPRRAAGGHPGL